MKKKAVIGPIEKRVRELWEEDGFCATEGFLHKKLRGKLLDKYIDASAFNISDVSSDEGLLKKWKAIDIRFAKLADKRKGKA
jgi:hypothetical protein